MKSQGISFQTKSGHPAFGIITISAPHMTSTIPIHMVVIPVVIYQFVLF